MTMALWSAPRTGTAWNSSTRIPFVTKPWSILSSLEAPDQGPQVGCTRQPDFRATATAASVNWADIRLYSGHSGVALKSPTTMR